jgi:hypothetical protein
MFKRIITIKTHRTDIRDPYIVMLTPAGVYARMGAGMTSYDGILRIPV